MIFQLQDPLTFPLPVTGNTRSPKSRMGGSSRNSPFRISDFRVNSHLPYSAFMTHSSMLLRSCLLMTFWFTLASSFAQRLAHVPGDFIVHTSSNEALQQLLARASEQRGIPTRLRVVRPLAEASGIWLLHMDHTKANQRELLLSIRSMPGVIAAQYNHILEPRSTPNDSSYSGQWQWNNTGQTGGKPGADISLPDAWEVTTGGLTATGDTIVVAIVDDGINLNHPDLAGNLWVNYKEVPGNGLDDDGNGYVDDRLGWNTTQGNDNVGVGGSHGTRVAGMIGARGNNQIGVTGVNWNVKMMIIRPISTVEATVIESYNYALAQRKLYNQTNGQKGAFVVAVNSSWGINYGKPEDAPLWCAFYDSMGVHGILNVAATANLDIDVDIEGDLPTACNSPFLVSVTSTNHSDNKANAGYGLTTIDLGAPGQSVLTTTNNGGTGTTSGTSFASPTVAGIIGLLYSAPCDQIGPMASSDPAMTALYIKDALVTSVDTLSSLWGKTLAGGRANAANALQQILDQCSSCPGPIQMQVASQGKEMAEVTWAAPAGESKFFLRWRQFGGGSWTEEPNVQSPFLLTGLSKCTNYEVQIRTECASENSVYFTKVFSTNGCCTAPANVSLSEIGTSSASLLLSSPPAGSPVWVAYTDPTTGSTQNLGPFTDTLIVVQGLTACTPYTFEVTSQCAGEVSEPTPVTLVTIGCSTCAALPACPSKGTDSSLEFIKSVSIGSLFNESADNGGYADFTSLSTDLLTFYKYPYTLTPGFAGGFSYTETWNVWIDFNQDGDFDDAGELIIGPTPSPTPVSGFIKIPGNAVPGSARMRISMSFGAGAGPCSTFSFGEVEDYCVNIITAQEPCDFPDQTTLVSASQNTATISWTPIGSAKGYIVEYREEGAPSWIQENVSASPFTIQGLVPCTDYEVRVATNCDTALSLFNVPIQFTTKGCGACLDFAYCPSGGTATTSQWIEEMSVASVTNTTGSDGGYAFFPELPIVLKTNFEYDLTIKPNGSFGINDNYYRVYIDYNQNGIFQPFELVAFVDDTDAGTVTLNFEVPAGAPAGPTRMRVMAQSFFEDKDPCLTFGTGEVEDYCVTIEKADAPCIPRPLFIDQISVDTVVLGWKDVKPATGYVVEYRLLGDTVWTSNPVTGSSFTITPIASCKEYEARMLTICAPDSTAYGPVFTFKSFGCGACLDYSYCESLGNFSSLEWIEAVEINEVESITGDDGGYVFIEDSGMSIDTGKTYTITITPGYSNTQYQEYFQAWIDFDQDGLFELEERILSQQANVPVNANFTVPGVALGNTRLRVSMAFGTQVQACDEFSSGEVEDYCIQLTPGEIPCLVPGEFDTVMVTETNASVAWDSAATGIAYIIRFKEVGATSWKLEEVTLDNSFTFPGLQPCKEYVVQLVTICQNKTSEPDSVVFKTSCPTSIGGVDGMVSSARVLPNPSIGQVSVELTSPEGGVIQLQVVDARGSVALSQQAQFGPGRNQVNLERANELPPGLYLIRLTDENGMVGLLKMIRQ